MEGNLSLNLLGNSPCAEGLAVGLLGFHELLERILANKVCYDHRPGRLLNRVAISFWQVSKAFAPLWLGTLHLCASSGVTLHLTWHKKRGRKRKTEKKLRKLAHPDVSHEPGDRSRMAVHGPPETCLQQVSARDGDASVVRHPCRVNAGSTRKYVSLSGSAMRPSSNTSNLTALSESVDLKKFKNCWMWRRDSVRRLKGVRAAVPKRFLAYR